MSIRVSSDEELHELCVHTLAWHGDTPRGGIAGHAIAPLFAAIRIAQHVAFAVGSDDETIILAALNFPTSAPPRVMLNRIALQALYDGLTGLRYNDVDQHGSTWLPDKWVLLLDQLITRTAVKAAGF
jgi:hypothetical protein